MELAASRCDLFASFLVKNVLERTHQFKSQYSDVRLGILPCLDTDSIYIFSIHKPERLGLFLLAL